MCMTLFLLRGHSNCRSEILCLQQYNALFFNNPQHTRVHLMQCECTTKDIFAETYSGSSPGSEREVQAIMEYFPKISPVYGAIDFHSYGQEVLFPYGKLIIHIIVAVMHVTLLIHPLVSSSLLFHTDSSNNEIACINCYKSWLVQRVCS